MAGGGAPGRVIGIDPVNIIQGGSTLETSPLFIARFRATDSIKMMLFTV